MALGFVDGIGMKSEQYYELYARDYVGEPVAVVSTAGVIGPATGKSVWRIQIRPHPWAQEIADVIWENKWEEPTNETQPPGKTVCKTGWTCGLNVKLEYSGVPSLEA